MAFNIGKSIGGPALTKNRGVTGYTASEITTSFENDTFDVVVEPFGVYRKRSKGKVVKIKWKPSGRIVEALSYLNRYAVAPYGSLASPERFAIASADATGNLITTAAHNVVTPEWAMFVGSTLPAPLTESDLKAARGASGTTLSLHASYAAAVANTSPLDLTSAGSAGSFIDISRSLLIHAFDGTWVRFFNVALTGVPSLTISTGATMLGEVEFTAYPKIGTPPGGITEGSFYETGTTALADTSFPDSDLPTVVPIATLTDDPDSLGTMYFNKGLTVDVKPDFAAVDIDGLGVAAHRLQKVEIDLKGQPFGLSVAQMAKLVEIEEALGADSAGFSVSCAFGDVMTLDIPSVRGRMSEGKHGSNTQRAGDLSLFAQRSLTAGSEDPLFTLAEAA